MTRYLSLVAQIVALVFLQGNTAFGHDCSSAADCQNVVTGSALLAGLLALALGATAAKKKPPWKENKTKKEFKNCKEAADYIKNAPETAEADARIKPQVGAIKVSEQADGTFEATVDVTWVHDADNSAMSLPSWSWPNMTPADTAALKDFTDAIKVHEQGHMQVADDFGKSISGTQKGTGTSAEDATKDLKTQLDKYVEKSQTDLDKRTKDYDDATTHGATQDAGPAKGFPGGKNAFLQCP